MTMKLPSEGAATPELMAIAHQLWMEKAGNHGVDLSGFDPLASLDDRLAWAQSQNLEIAVPLSRFSTKHQDSTSDQVRECVEFAAANKMYVPPEYICVDEGKSGRKLRRDGLERAQMILQRKLARTLLVFKISRLFRQAYRGYMFINEQVVEEGLRAISVSQRIDTDDAKIWKTLICVHGLADEMLLEAISDHVRIGLQGLFKQGFVTGAMTIGYIPVVVPEGRPTKLGRPRTMPGVNPEVAKLIRKHYEMIRDGMSLAEGLRRWVREGGPYDRRSKTKRMTATAYRHMLSNPRYLGVWAFGRKRNSWSAKRDYTRQIDQPETEVLIVRTEELRIVSDELFFAVQNKLAERKIGPRGPKKKKDVQLCDLVADSFLCDHCSQPGKPIRYYHSSSGQMVCKQRSLCGQPTTLHRRKAVRGVCRKLAKLLQQDAALIEQTILSAQAIDATSDEPLREELAVVERKIASSERKISDLTDLAGEGSDDDRELLKSKVRAAQAERTTLLHRRAALKESLNAPAQRITAEQVRSQLADLTQLLEDAAAGLLGEDLVYRAAALFRSLVGGRIMVRPEQRAERQESVVRGYFTPRLFETVQAEINGRLVTHTQPVAEVWAWLREPPMKDHLAERVHQMLDVQKMNYPEVTAVLRAEGYKVRPGNVADIHKRYFEMIEQPMPKRPYNNGRRRNPRRPPAA